MCYKPNFRLDGNVLIVQVKRENTVFEISLENHWKMLPSVMKMLGKRPMPKNSEVTGSIILSSTSVNKKDLLIAPDPKDGIESQLSRAIHRALFSNKELNYLIKAMRRKFKSQIKKKMRKSVWLHIQNIKFLSDLMPMFPSGVAQQTGSTNNNK
jgi:hypothetical protein